VALFGATTFTLTGHGSLRALKTNLAMYYQGVLVSIPESVRRRYFFYRYVFLPLYFSIFIVLACVAGWLVGYLRYSLPQHLSALIATLVFEIIYLPSPVITYFVAKFCFRKIREFYEKYRLGEGDRAVMTLVTNYEEQLKMLKALIIVATFLCAILSIIWGYYFYTHWPNLLS